MKTIWIFLSVAFFITSFHFTGCSKENDREFKPVAQINLDTITFSHSMKGWELYSWPNGKKWNYSLLPGTNRLKSYEEVTRNKIIVTGIDSLKLLLAKLPENEEITWIGEGWLKQIWGGGYGDLCLPDTEIIDEIRAFCVRENLYLTVTN
jgi:hypothetical protein